MGRVRKPKLEGMVYTGPVIVEAEALGLAPIAPPEVVTLPYRPADPVPGNNGAALSRIVEYFKLQDPAKWEELQLCPLKHGLDTMINLLSDPS